MPGEKKSKKMSEGYDNAKISNGQRIASKVNKKGIKPAKSSGGKEGGATKMW